MVDRDGDGRRSLAVPPSRRVVGAVASVLVHGAIMAWAVVHEAARPPVPAPAPDVIEVLRVDPIAIDRAPLALRAVEGSSGVTRPRPHAPASARAPKSRPRTIAPARDTSARAPVPAAPVRPVSTGAPAAATPVDVPAADASAADASGTLPPAAAGDAHEAIVAAGLGSAGAGAGEGLRGTDVGPDHSAYGAELVRRVKAEIDIDPVPGLGPRDSIEVVLEVLPSGRLARRGLGKYDYARVVHSTLGPARVRAILRRILRASEGFPPHPSSFPRERYVVGFTVRFRDRAHG